jgi:hypothetical protein
MSQSCPSQCLPVFTQIGRSTSQTEPDADPAHPRKDEIDAKEESQNVEA